MKKLTQKEKIKKYENLFNLLHVCQITLSQKRAAELVKNICDYASALGGGEMSDEEIQENIRQKFDDLLK